MAYLDVWELVDKSTFNGQEALNVFFYQNTDSTTPPAGSSDLVSQYIATVLPKLVQVQGNNVLHTEISARNLFSPSDNHTESISTAGAVTGDLMPNFNAFGFKMTQDNGAVKNGAKRFAGVSESAATDGVVTDSATIGALDDLATAMGQTLTVGVANVFAPVIIKRILETTGYRLPTSFGEAIIGLVIEVAWNTLLTSQTSRKIGVGA